MIKPTWAAVGGLALLGTAGGIGLLVASSGGEEEVNKQVATPPVVSAAPALTPGPGVTLWRWMNVTVLIPSASGITAGPNVLYLDAQGTQSRQVLSVGKADTDDSEIFSYVQIDAQNGMVLSQQILDQHRAEIELVLATIAVSPLDAKTAPWPYNGEGPTNAPREAPFGISLIRPDPATGIFIDYVYSADVGYRGGVTPAPCEGGSQGIQVRNGRSSAGFWVDAKTGSLCRNLTNVHPDDLAAFERYSADVKRCGTDVQC